jgi:putative aldouronate transport system substrate-binding protein
LKKIKLVSLLLASVVAFTVTAAGCSKSGEGKKQVDNPAGGDTAKLEKVLLKYYFPAGGGVQKDQAEVQKAVNDITLAKINAELELNPIDWGAWFQRMPLILNSGEQVDMVFTATWTGFVENANNKIFRPLDELFDKYGQDIKKTIHPALIKGPRIDGKLYAVPTNKELTSGWTHFFKKDLIDKAGVDISKVKYLEDLEEVFAKVKAVEPGVYPIWNGERDTFTWDRKRMVENSGMDIEGVENGVAAVFDIKSKKVVADIDLPWKLEEYKLMRSWQEKGYINPDSMTNQTKPVEAVKSGKALTFWWSNAQPGILETAKNEAGMDLYGVTSSIIGIKTSETVASLLAIPTVSKNPERAMMAINLLHSDPKLVTTINLGVEGKHYVKVNDKQYRLPDGVANAGDTGYSPGIGWMVGNMFLNPVLESQPMDLWDKYAEFNKTGKEVYLLGFIFNTSGVETEKAAINTVNEQYGKILATGSAKDVEKVYNEYRKKLYDSGLQKVLDEMQKQIDEWIKVNKQ